MGQRIDSLYWDLDANTSPLLTSVGAAQGRLGGFARFMRGAGGPIAVVAGFGLAATAAGKRINDFTADLDIGLREVATLLPETRAELGNVRDAVVDLSTRVPDPPVMLTRALYQAVSAGARDTAEALEIVEVASRAAVGGLSDTFTAVDAITTVLNAYGMAATEAERVSDVFFKTVEQGKITFPEIAGSIGGVATTAAQLGISIEEVGAAMAAMTKRGLSVSETVTALNRFFLSFINNTDEARAAQAALGVEVSAQAIRSKGLVGVLEEMAEATGGNVEELVRLNPNIRALRAALVLAEREGLETFKEALEATTDAEGAARRASDELMGAKQNLEKVLRNRVNAIFLELGESTLPVYLSVLETLIEVTGAAEDSTIGLAEAADQYEASLNRLFQAIRRAPGLAVGALAHQLTGGLTRSLVDLPGMTDPPRVRIPELADLEPLANQLREVNDLQAQMNLVTHRLMTLERVRSEHARRDNRAQVEELDRIIAAHSEVANRIHEQMRAQQRAATVDPPPDPPEVPVELTSQVRALANLLADLRDLGAEFRDVFTDPALVEAQRALEAGAVDQERALSRSVETLERMRDALEDFQRRRREGTLTDLPEGVDRIGVREGSVRAAANVVRGLLAQGERDFAVYQRALDALGVTMEELEERYGTLRREIRAFTDELPESTGETDRAGDATEDLGRQIQNVVRDLADGIRGVVQFAQALGLLDASAASAVSSLTDLGGGVAMIAGSGGNPLAIAAGVGRILGGLGGLFGGGDPEAARRRQAIERNIEALDRLRHDLQRLGEVFRGMTGRQIAGLQALAERIGEFSGETVSPLDRPTRETAEEFLGLRRALSDLGLSVFDLERIAQASGISVDALVEVIRTGKGDFHLAAEQWNAVRGAVLAAADAADTFSRAMDHMRADFERFDITDPLDRFRRILAELEGFTEAPGRRIGGAFAGQDALGALMRALRGLSLDTEEGRADAIDMINAFIDRLRADPSLAPGVDPDEAERMLIEMIANLRRAGEEAGRGAQAFEEFQGMDRIMANRLIAQGSTQIFWLEQIARNTSFGEPVGLSPPPVPSANGASAVGTTEERGAVQVGPFHFEIQRGDTPEDTARRVSEIVYEHTLDRLRGLGQ